MVYIERDIERELFKWINDREIILIRGPRQCGKTTLLERIKENLSKNSKNNIIMISFENNITRMQFEENCIDFIKSRLSNEKNYYLFDEVQYVREIGQKLKLIFDTFKDIKIIVTGSSSFDLTSLGKYLVGRVIFFDLFPFNFGEFLKSKGEKYHKIYQDIKIKIPDIKLKKSIFIDELNNFLFEYLTFGGYPRIVLEENHEKKTKLISDIFTTYVEKDIISLYGNKYRDSAVKLLKSLSYILGGLIKYEKLTENTGLKNQEIREILPLLQDSFVIKIVPPFYSNKLNELRKNQKVYFVDFGIRNYLFGSFNNLDYDFLYENFVLNQLKDIKMIKFWRTTQKTEVDFVIDGKDKIPIEIRTGKKITRSLRSFIEKYKPPFAIIANLKEVSIKEKYIYFIPFIYF